MAQADGVVANGTGSAVRSDINNQYAALWSNHSGSTEPSSGKVAYQFWADTNTNILKIRNSANNAWINLFTLAGGIDVDAASNFNEDVTFTGASANAVWDKSDNALEFADNAKCILGTGGDLELFHDTTDSKITNHTGILRINSNDIYLKDKNEGDMHIRCLHDGSSALYYDGSRKIETTNEGCRIGGTHTASTAGDDLIIEGSSDRGLSIISGSSSTANIYLGDTDDTDVGRICYQHNDNELQFYANAGKKGLVINSSGVAELYIDGTKKFNTTSGGCYIHGNLYPTSDGSGSLGTTGERWQQLFLKNTNTVADLNCDTTTDVTGVVLRHGRGGLSGYGGTIVSFRGNDNTEEGSIVIGVTSTAYNTSSDYRLKENQVAISDGITRLKQLKPYRFNFKKHPEITVDGFFAHEVTSVVSEAIYGDKDATNSDGSINPQQIDQSKLVPLLTAALQEAIIKIETLETKVAALEAK